MPAARRRLVLVRAAALVAGSAALGTTAPAPGAGAAPPIAFQDLSALSGGPVDFGAPKSTLEKATCAFLDADGDGWDDLVSLAGKGEPHRYFLNRDDGQGGREFVPAPAGNGLDTGPCLERDGAGLTAGDVDGDGDEDLFIGSSWNSTFAAGEGENVLLLNDGTGRFSDVAASAGLLDGDNTTCASVLFDMDNDGDLDLFTCNTSFAETKKEGDGLAHLWRNEMSETGVLHFVDETAARGIVENGVAVWCATASDFDDDGDADLLIGHDVAGTTQLFRNLGDGTFTDITTSAGAGAGDDGTPSTFGDDSYAAMGAAWGDIDNDGDFDLYITNTQRNPLYRNNGDGTLTEIGKRANVRGGLVTWGCSFADFDGDGFVDLYAGGGDLWDMERDGVVSYLFRNRGDGTFVDVLGTAGMRRDAPLHRENGSACTDFDGDGRVDMLVSRAERAGASPYLYRNVTETYGRRWLTVTLRGNGRTSNTSAIGARIRVVPRNAAGAPIAGLAQLREVSGGDSRSSRSSLSQTVGLGIAAESADIVVTWPRAGTLEERTQTYVDVPLNRRVTLTEDAREAPTRFAVVADVTVPDGTLTQMVCPGAGDPLTTLRLVSGPAWASIGPWSDGRTVVFDAPRVDAEHVAEVALAATAQGAAVPDAHQTLTVHVVPAPRLATAKRRGTTQIELTGDHVDLTGLLFRIDGTPVKRLKAWTKIRRPGGTAVGYARLAVPKAIRKSVRRKGGHTVEALDPVHGWTATVRF